MLSKSGNVSNTGICKTKVSGDIGTNLDVTIGYIPGNLNGTIHLVSGASAQSAADDLTLLDNNYFGTLAPVIQLLYAAAFGDGLVLTPHIYYMNGTTTLNFKTAIKSNFEASLIVQN